MCAIKTNYFHSEKMTKSIETFHLYGEMMNKILLFILIACFAVLVFSFEVSTEWSKTQGMTNSLADKKIVIKISLNIKLKKIPRINVYF